MELLIAEDDVALAGFLRRGLESEGYQVQVVGDGKMALEALACWDGEPNLARELSTGSAPNPAPNPAPGRMPALQPDLAILDLNLPGMDGIEVLRQARESGATLPILVLTGRNELETRLQCLDLGADDCMFKPFSLQELRARCRMLMRRVPRLRDAVMQVRDLSMHRMERMVERGGRRIALTNREYGLLEQLLLERGRCVSRASLLEKVWGVASSETNVVDVYVNYLRRKLDDGAMVPLIETVRGKGYRIAMPVRPLSGSGVPAQRIGLQPGAGA